MRKARVVSATEMLSTRVVANSSNNNRETTVAQTSSSMDNGHKALKSKIFNQNAALLPRHLSALAVQKNRPATPATATTAVNLATMRGSAEAHPNRTGRSRAAHATTMATNTSNMLTRSQQSRISITRLLMRTLKNEPLGTRQNTSKEYQSVVSTISPFDDARKLAGVPGQIINYHNHRILVDSGSPLTIICFNLWKQIKDPNLLVNEVEECFHEVKHNGLKFVKVTHKTLHFGKLHVKHQVLIVDKIAHKFILGNDFLTQ